MLNYLSKVLYVLSGRRQKLAMLLFVVIVASVLEAFGIGLIGPFIRIASQPQMVHEVGILSWFYSLLNLQTESDFIPILGLTVAVVFCLKSVIYFFARAYIYHFSFTQKTLLNSRLLNAYLSVPYTFHLKHNTASLVENIIVEVDQFTQNCLLQILTAFTNLVISAALILLLARTSSSLLILIAVAILPLIIFAKVFKERFKRWGKNRAQSNQAMVRILNHSLGSIRETRLIGCESYFDSKMTRQGDRFSRAATLFLSSQLFPRILIESVLVVLIVAYISVFHLFSQQSVEDLTSILGVFAVASMRLIPSTSQFVQAVSRMQNSSYTLDVLYNDLKEVGRAEKEISTVVESVSKEDSAHRNHSGLSDRNRREEAFEFNQQICLSNVSYRYPEASSDAIQDISFTIKKGESIALIGKSGSGKTTLVNIILGLLTPSEGDILVDSKSVYSNLRRWQRLVGYIPQSIFLIDDTVERNIAFGVPDHLIDAEKLNRVIRATQLEALMLELPDGVKTQVGEQGVRLSGGQRQRIGIARALYHEREILVLDEATSALDSETERQISQSISALAGSKTLIIIAHRLSTVEACDRLYRLEGGQIVDSGSYEKVVALKK